jgi:hypothetical protein
MKKITTVFAALTIGAAAIGISIAPPAAAAPSNCQTVGATVVCGQGNVSGGGQSAGAPNGPVSAPVGGGCQNAYGGYQNCNVGR